MTAAGIKIGYARVSTSGQDLTAQRNALAALGVEEERHLAAPHATGDHTPGDLAHLFGVGRSTVYRALTRASASTTAPPAATP